MVASAARSPLTAPHTESHVGSFAKPLRKLLTALHALVGVAAIAGGVVLVANPSGATLGLSPSELSAFRDFFIPGALLALFGVLQLVAAVWSVRPGATAVLVSQWAGALLVLWIAFESALVGPIHPLQIVGMLIGAFIYIVAHELHADEPHTPLLPPD
jgi:hypothetical protein